MEKTFAQKREFLSERNILSGFRLKNLRKRDFGILIGVQLLMLSAIYAVISFRPYYEALHFERMGTLSGRILIISLLVILTLQVLFLIYVVYLFTKYKPIASVSDAELPTCTIIVPAYNEGELVYHTLKSISESNYPKEKLEIMAIDDGSKDDTWEWIKKANEDLGDWVKDLQTTRKQREKTRFTQRFYYRNRRNLHYY
nr:glycosyltransferase [Chryseobacterium sp.]